MLTITQVTNDEHSLLSQAHVQDLIALAGSVDHVLMAATSTHGFHVTTTDQMAAAYALSTAGLVTFIPHNHGWYQLTLAGKAALAALLDSTPMLAEGEGNADA